MVELIDEIVQDKYKIHNVNGKYVLDEKNEKRFPKTYLKTVGKTILYKFDDDPKLLNFFKDIKNVKSMADYVLFVEKNDRVFAFIIELSCSRYKDYQQESTRIFVDFIINTCQRVLNYQKEKTIFKYICIVKKPLKGQTKMKITNNFYLCAGTELKINAYCI